MPHRASHGFPSPQQTAALLQQVQNLTAGSKLQIQGPGRDEPPPSNWQHAVCRLDATYCASMTCVQGNVPARIRRELGLFPGVEVEFVLRPTGALLRKTHNGKNPINKIYGSLPTKNQH